MEHGIHRLPELFKQLGLPNEPAAIESFLAAHRPLAPDVALADAPFWSPSQAQFLREKLCDDSDWAELVDQLGHLLTA